MWKESDWEHLKTRDANGSMMWMDAPHVEQIYELLMANTFEDVLEIGAWDGFSTTALVQAQKDGAGFTACVCDVELRPALRELVKGQRFVLYQGKSVDLLKTWNKVDLAIVDGDHSVATVKQEMAFLLDGTRRTIVLHDAGRQHAEGPWWAFGELVKSSHWRVFLDDKPREGYNTERGLVIATNDTRVRTKRPNYTH